MLNGYIYTLPYNIKGSVATLRAGHAYSVLFLPKYGLMAGKIATCMHPVVMQTSSIPMSGYIADSLLLTTKQGVN